jgi:microsomal dipeptidase-like Zn-dependent dipeptidase
LSEAGVELLKEFMRMGMILDVTHLADQSFFQALGSNRKERARPQAQQQQHILAA